MNIRELDVVTLTRDLPEQGLAAGATGTVVHVFHAPRVAYEVEFIDENGSTQAMVTLTQDQFTVGPS